MFTQVDRSLEKAQGGLGIGLNIVKRLVRYARRDASRPESGGHGREPVRRAPAGGLVAAGTTEGRTPTNGGPQSKSARRRILVVDDNRDGATSLAMMLQAHGERDADGPRRA